MYLGGAIKGSHTGKQFPVVVAETTPMNSLWQEIEKEEHTDSLDTVIHVFLWNDRMNPRFTVLVPGTCRLGG